MENKEISVVTYHVRKRILNGNKINVDYEEVQQFDKNIIVRYKVYINGKQLPLVFTISKEILLSLFKNNGQNIFSEIPESILEYVQKTHSKTEPIPLYETELSLNML